MSDVANRNHTIAPVLTRFGRIRTWAETALASVHHAQRAIGELPADLDEQLLREVDQAARTAELSLERLLKAEWVVRRKYLARFPAHKSQ